MLLLQHGAAVDATTKDLYTPLHIAAKEGQEEVSACVYALKCSKIHWRQSQSRGPVQD
jgi:ankyrin repeat protein